MTTPVGRLLRQWRTLRRYSQLDLALATDVSARHLSFVETGRSQPSRQLIRRLAEHLEVPPREQNRLLLAGGFAPAYPEHDLDSPDLADARRAVRELLLAHEPYPALAVDRMWNVVDSNAGVDLLMSLVSPALLAGTVNALRLTLHPEGLAPHLTNLGQWRAAVLGSLQRSAEARDDDTMRELYDELAGYPHGGPEPEPHAGAAAVHVPLRLRFGDRDLTFLSVVATLGTATDITLSELAIESFFPADASTRDFLRSTGP